MNAQARQIGSTAACLLVRDVRAAAQYYAEKFGFVAPQLWGEPEATFAIPTARWSVDHAGARE